MKQEQCVKSCLRRQSSYVDHSLPQLCLTDCRLCLPLYDGFHDCSPYPAPNVPFAGKMLLTFLCSIHLLTVGLLTNANGWSQSVVHTLSHHLGTEK